MTKRSSKRSNRAIALIAGLVLVIGLVPATALAAGGQLVTAQGATRSVVASGTCGADGDNLKWELDDSGTLTIFGTGAMTNYTSPNCGPWGKSIKSVVIEEGVTSIGDRAFHECVSLESVEISDGVRSIGKSAFLDCDSLKSVELPSSVTSISAEAFCDCNILECVTILGDVSFIGEGAFGGCHFIENIYYAGLKPWSTFSVGLPTGAKVHYLCTVVADPEEGGTVSIAADESESGPLTGTKWVESGKKVTLTAVPKDGMGLIQWSTEDLEGFGNPDKAEASFTMPDKAVTVTATFREVMICGDADGNPIKPRVYNGEAQKPEVVVYLRGVDDLPQLIADYEVEYADNVNVTTEAKAVVTLTTKVGGGTAKFEITPASFADAEVEVADQVYDGTALKPAPAVTWNGKQVAPEDFTAEYADNVRAGKATVKVTGRHNFQGDASKTATFSIAKRPLTVTTGSAAKAYDGKALTNGEASIEGLVNGEAATVKAIGSQTEVGSSKNTCSIEWGTAKAENYTVVEKLGTLTVEAAPAKKGTLTFDLAGGTLDGKTGTITVVANVGDTVKLPGEPTRKGYTFKYWKGSRYEAGAEYKVEGDHAFTAVWEKNSSSGSGSSGKSSSGRTAKTGDPLGLVPPLVIALVAASGLALAISWRRRRG